jgi:Ca2+-binding EF-hand superfamily protein
VRSMPKTFCCGLSILVALGALTTGAVEIDAARLFGDLDADANGRLTSGELGDEHRLLFKRLLRTGDEDGDGRLSAAEFAAALVPVRADKSLVEKTGSRVPGADALTVLLAMMDANGDRQLEANEIPERCRRLFQQMLRPADGNKDGSLSPRELAQAAPRLGVMAQVASVRMGLDVPAELAKLPAEQVAATDQMDAYRRPGQKPADPTAVRRLMRQLLARFDRDDDRQLSRAEAPPRLAENFDRADADANGLLDRAELSRVALAMARAKKPPRTKPGGDR